MNEGQLRDSVQKFAVANNLKAVSEIILTLLGYLFFMSVVYISYVSHSWILYVTSCTITALLMVKLFTIQHDCGHNSFFTNNTANTWVGRFFALLTTMPFTAWKEEHNVHHSHVADIDQIGHGDVLLLTVAQYKALSPFKKASYRVLRHPLFFLTIAPFYYFFVKSKYPGIWNRENILSVLLTSLFVVLIYGSLAFFLGFWTMVFVFVPAAYFGGILGLGLFYIQHDYPGVSWFQTEEWAHETAALEGSSLLILPQPLEWLSHAIGYHHIHHLNSKIPGYRLRECYTEVPQMQDAEPLRWKDIVYAFRMKLWSRQKKALVTFSEISSLTK